LISLDENIEHLDEQLTHREENSDLLQVENDALLTQEEENFLFQSMPEVMDPLAGWNLDPRDAEIEELIAAGLPSPLMPSPFRSDDEHILEDVPKTPAPLEQTTTFKQEIKEEPVEENDNQLYSTGDVDLSWLEPYMSPPLSPSESLASTNLPSDLLESEDITSSHLVDHNYALSAFEECFGIDSPSSSISQKTSSYTSSTERVGGASALSGSTRESRDDRKARELNLPFAVGDIIDLPIDAFNELLTRHTLTEDQLVLCRDIRRRGKNKVAAQNCRKRKMDLISQLEEEVNSARHQKQILLAEREELYRLRNEWTHKLLNLESAVFRGINKNVDEYAFDYSGPTVKVTTRLAKAKA